VGTGETGATGFAFYRSIAGDGAGAFWKETREVLNSRQCLSSNPTSTSARRDRGVIAWWRPSSAQLEQEILMAAGSTLDPDNFNLPDRQIGKGHGTGALGPSDTSDSGSDLQGGDGLSQDVGMDLDSGNTSAPEGGTRGRGAGPDIGDANLDSDSDSSGTGETAAAGRDSIFADGDDIDIDDIEEISADSVEGLDGDADSDASPDGELPEGDMPTGTSTGEPPNRGRLH
jgi:hypothetical protein